MMTFGASPNSPDYARRCGFHLLPFQFDALNLAVTIHDPTNIAPLYLGRLVAGPITQPEKNFDYGWEIGLDDDTNKKRTPRGQTTTNSRVPVPYVNFTIRHLSKRTTLLHLYELQRKFGMSQPLVVCCNPEEDEVLQMVTMYGTLGNLSPMPNPYKDKWEATFKVEAML
jgi:hypothetical protein